MNTIALAIEPALHAQHVHEYVGWNPVMMMMHPFEKTVCALDLFVSHQQGVADVPLSQDWLSGVVAVHSSP
eukprot:m.116952 g.116952  ORF g.116952 m.116952 type:complete len:71 (-) comp13619_c0_seq1:26-238(-)